MKNKKLRNYCLLSLLGVAAACFYPLYMGVRVVFDMIKDGTVMKENYPKYIIPYTPVAVALIVGVLLLPLFMKYIKNMLFSVSFPFLPPCFSLSNICLNKKLS